MRTLLTSLLCVLTLSLTAQVDCPNTYDGNGDGNVNINDLLDLLAVFGDSDSDGDGVWDSLDECIDTAACNYMANPSEPCAVIDYLGVCGGGCTGDGDSDGICDNEDDCVGELDECGVCNGPGPTEITIESITIIYDSVYAESIQEWLIFELTQDTTFVYLCYVIGCMDQGACNYNPEAIENDLSCEYETCAGCWDEYACNYDPNTQIQDDFLCEYESCAGCWDPVACNYDPTISIQNVQFLNLCEYESCSGCIQLEACNYDPLASNCYLLDGASWPNQYYIEDEQSYNYGISNCCEFESCYILGCTDPEGCNFSLEATYQLPDEYCGYNPCGFDCVYYGGDITDLYGDLYGEWPVARYGPNCWFNQNALYLPEVSPSNIGDSLVPHYYVYGYEGTDIEDAKQTDNYQNLGVLYNYAAVISGGICPSGSHVATDSDWMKLERYEGMEQGIAFEFGFREGDISILDSTGIRNTEGYFSGLALETQYWSINDEGIPIKRALYSDSPNLVERAVTDKEIGLSVRCVH